MGIPGILKEIGKGERIALTKLAVEHLERTQRPLRIAIDAAIWNFQTQSGQGGKNPALRTLYYRLLKLLALPIHPLFVYDGKNKPLIKRGRAVSRWGTCIANETSKKLIHQFKFPCHVAPGEAEAECALLQKKGIVDMVMSQDGDAVMFGSRLTLRDWSKEGTRGNKTPTHVNLLDLPRLKERSGLDPDGMILVALLSGGDYDQDGVTGFGAGLACEAARAGFGTDLLELVRKDDDVGLQEWRERLQFELETNESGYFKRRHKTLKIPETFPDRTILGYYINPAVSQNEDLTKLERKLSTAWDEDIEVPELRRYAGDTFDWLYKPGAWKFVRSMAPPLLAHRLRRGLAGPYFTSVDQIRERRQHFTNDGIPELRVAAVPADIVGLDLEAEEDSPEYLARLAEDQEQDEADDDAVVADEDAVDHEEILSSQQPRKQRKPPPWNPNEPEKMWIPETVVQLGVPALVEEWQQNERDKLADPKKFAARKCKKTAVKAAATAQVDRIDQYLGISRVAAVSQKPIKKTEGLSVSNPAANAAQQPRTPTKRRPEPALQSSSPDIKQFFKVTKPANRSPQLEHLQTAADAMNAPEVAKQQRISATSNRSIHVSAETQIDPFSALSSSPRASRHGAVSSAPSTPQKGASTGGGGDADGLAHSVTGRRRRPRRAEVNADQAQPRRVIERSKTVASFFESADADSNSSLPPSSELLQPTGTALPADPSTGLQVDFLRKKLHAVPRESLPGTWRDLNLDEGVLSVKSKRTARISCVNLIED